MRQTNVCLNRVFKVYLNFAYNLYPGVSSKILCLQKKCVMKIERKQQRKMKKMTSASYKVTREMRAR